MRGSQGVDSIHIEKFKKMNFKISSEKLDQHQTGSKIWKQMFEYTKGKGNDLNMGNFVSEEMVKNEIRQLIRKNKVKR